MAASEATRFGNCSMLELDSSVKKEKERKGTLFKFLVVLALEHQLGTL